MAAPICYGFCNPVASGAAFGPILFVVAITIASVVLAVLLLYAGLGGHQHGPFTPLEYRDLHETVSRCATCGEIVAAPDGYHSHPSVGYLS